MTCREKLALEHPDKIAPQYTGDCYGCPFDYGYLDREHCHCSDVTSCAECWSREIPEDIINKSGAVRDMCEGKGRCDLLPLDVIAQYTSDPIFYEIANFQMFGDINCLYRCITYFEPNWDDGKTKASEDDIYKQRMYTGFLEVAKHFEEDAKQYGDDNWKKGTPVRVFIDSAVWHYLKFLKGDKDEPHDRAFCWSIMCAIWTCKHKPELNDYACNEEESK